ncbi:MAG: hypothetical protein NC818_04245 [Candidatus Omnitrophica bacterium]|nr:hypothetical protein [Candidatus Omnitrophota bacterium]
MKRFIFYFLLSLCVGMASADEVWENITGSLDHDLYSLAISPFDGKIIYVGSDKAVFKTENKGNIWQYLYTVKGESQKINFILFDPKDKNTVYLATSHGLFRTLDNGKSFQKIFRKETNVFYVIKNFEDALYLGTNNGVYLSIDRGGTWNRLSGIPQGTEVFSLAIHPALPRLVYAVCNRGVYRSFDKGENWERVFVTQGIQEESTEDDGENEGAEEIEVSSLIPRSLLINRSNPSFVYLGTTKGLYVSSDSGRTWDKRNIANLGGVDVRYIVAYEEPDLLYLATNKGIFKVNLNKLRAEEVYQDLPTQDVRMLALDKEHTLWAVTAKGLFRTVKVTEGKSVNKDSYLEEYEFYFRDEPTIQEVRKEAIRYAEVYPEKIKNWRTQARLKAFVPEFDLDYDKTISIYGAQSYERVVVGPRDWGMSLRWDLGDLIWSTDQTSIDVRSRLMVQLRDDILDETNRLYYERRRVKLGLLLNPPQDLKERLEKQIRLDELTAGLDALTGGYFSKRLKELSNKE